MAQCIFLQRIKLLLNETFPGHSRPCQNMFKILILCLVITCCNAVTSSRFRWNIAQDPKDFSCQTGQQSCHKCLQNAPCTWCGVKRPYCTKWSSCPTSLRHESCSIKQDVEYKLEELEQEKQVTIDLYQTASDVRSLCYKKVNCTSCTENVYCGWCVDEGLCAPYSKSTSLCGEKSLVKVCDDKQDPRVSLNSQITKFDQIHHSKPCHLHNTGCSECVSDSACYWCDSPRYCGLYRDGSDNCTKEHRYYGKCHHNKPTGVLVPIIGTMATPVIAYIVMYLIVCYMKKSGYEGLPDSDTSDDEDHCKPIVLRHDSFRSKTDELKSKYGLHRKH